MIGFTKEQLADISEYQGISTEGDLAAFALALLDRAENAEAERDRLIERMLGKSLAALNEIAQELIAETERGGRG